MNVAEQLAQGVAALGLEVPAVTQRKLLDYVALIAKWNRVHNLTAVRETGKMVSHHVLDCLAVAPHLAAGNVLDVGSGAGLPGIPLALLWPQVQVTLLDSSHKKTAFLRQAVIELDIRNAEIVCERAETWRPEGLFELVITRAVADLRAFLAIAGRLCTANGTLAAMKGVYPTAELAELPPEFRLRSAISLVVPGLRAARHLVLLEPVR